MILGVGLVIYFDLLSGLKSKFGVKIFGLVRIGSVFIMDIELTVRRNDR